MQASACQTLHVVRLASSSGDLQITLGWFAAERAVVWMN